MLKQKNNKRRTAEIYFVLYLSALVLLISKTSHKEEQIVEPIQHQNFDFPFMLKPEKTVLVCRIWLDSLGNKQYEVDSLNYILDIGEVEDVRYDFVVEDQDLNHNVRLTNNSEYNSNIFKFKEENENRRAIFYWSPSLDGTMDRAYTVYVSATAKPLGGKNIQRLKAKTQFTLIITHLNDSTNKPLDIVENVSPEDRNFQAQEVNKAVDTQINIQTGEMNLLPERSKVKSLALQEWKNKIFCFGFNPKYDLDKTPVVTIKNNPKNNGGSIRIDSYLDNTIVLKGKTPAFGTSEVSLSVVRKNDLYETSISFEILPQNLEPPIYPEVMYPEQTYIFDPKLPLNDVENAIALIKYENKIIAANYQGGSIDFMPSENDIGKTFNFKRIIDGNLVGKTINIKVKSYPKPEITRIAQKTENTLILNVTSFGWKNKKENRIDSLIITGNATYRQLYGKTSEDRNKSIWFEQFEIIPINKNEEFDFSVIAVDTRGVKSKSVKYIEKK